MKKAAVLIGVFLFGLITGVVCLYLLVGRGPTMVYANALEGRADAALKVRLGEQERFLREFEANAPGDVEAVRAFGDQDFVRSALRMVKSYYEATGTMIPDRVAAAVASLPESETASAGSFAARAARFARLKVGDFAPPLLLESIDGQSLDLQETVVVLNFFATWSGACVAEMPRLEKDIWEPLREKGVVLVAVGRGHSASELELFRKEKRFSFPFVADPNREVYDQFASEYIPRCVLIGKDGRIKFLTAGFVLEEYPGLVKAVEREIGR